MFELLANALQFVLSPLAQLANPRPCKASLATWGLVEIRTTRVQVAGTKGGGGWGVGERGEGRCVCGGGGGGGSEGEGVEGMGERGGGGSEGGGVGRVGAISGKEGGGGGGRCLFTRPTCDYD